MLSDRGSGRQVDGVSKVTAPESGARALVSDLEGVPNDFGAGLDVGRLDRERGGHEFDQPGLDAAHEDRQGRQVRDLTSEFVALERHLAAPQIDH